MKSAVLHQTGTAEKTGPFLERSVGPRQQRGLLPVILLVCAFFSGCNSYFYWPEPRPPVPKSPTASGLQIYQFPSKDGTILQGWFIPSKTEETHGLIVYCHGADTNVGEYYEAVEFLPYNGFDLFLFDYRGYGASEGKPSRQGTIMDTHAAVDYAKQLPLVHNPVVALFGFSLGAGIALVVASERSDIVGVVNEGGFDTYRGIGRKVAGDRVSTWFLQFFAPILISKGYDPIDYVDKISPRPLYLIHSENDELVPHTMAERLYAKAKPPKKLWIVKGATHYNAPSERHPHYERRVAGYFRYIFATAEGEEPDVPPDCLPGGILID